MPTSYSTKSLLLSLASLLALTTADQGYSPSGSPGGSNGEFCVPFKFKSNNPDWQFERRGLCEGTTNGKLGQDNADCCFKGSGAMFVSPISRGLGDGTYGNTIIECTIAPNAQGQSVCDISLVDGFSLAVQCGEFPSGDPSGKGTPEAYIGGKLDLSDLHTCKTPCQQGQDCTSCLNNGHGSAIDQFFTDTKGGNYWYQDNTAGKSTFIGLPKKGYVECTIGPQEDNQGVTGGNGNQYNNPGTYTSNAQVQKREGHRHEHKRGIHARRLHNLLGVAGGRSMVFRTGSGTFG
ncbi:uncharacterized protein KY384_005683 [Bacidia gigantensis]|uniref:uncharacterized protein n=1 Tax=Bacidia gigantensis TaxID=2732470 RepID=UPI001D05320B|nr:uncharacterized protein KY384_005683 [Bacidia gigantensis]KAG8529049.1 hypothetical protein KY384_005683 [Bacidia gigantensis]